MISRFPYSHLFFHFPGRHCASSSGIPLACLNGGIMADSGNEAIDYIFVCQDRYPVYAAMGGMRTLLFVSDHDHRQRLNQRITSVRKDLEIIRASTGILADLLIPDPLYIPCRLSRSGSQVCPDNHFIQQIRDNAIVNSQALGGIYFNQVSPTVTSLIEQFYGCLQGQGRKVTADLDACRFMGRQALKWHGKADYVRLVDECETVDSLPEHVPTAMLTASRLAAMTWGHLCEYYTGQTGMKSPESFFIKSAMDAAGEVCICVTQDSFMHKRGVILDDMQHKIRAADLARQDPEFLVQPRIPRGETGNGLPGSIGITYNIVSETYFKPVVIIGHVYEDPERKVFIGSYMSDRLTRHSKQGIGEEKIAGLLRLFAGKGYRGPVNIDIVRSDKDRYVFIYDCNPRLGGSFPGLIAKKAIQASGIPVNTLLAAGYCGRLVYPDLRAKLKHLQDLNLLFTRSNPRGIYLVPSCVRPHSYDALLMNMEMDQMLEIVNSDVLYILSDTGSNRLKGIFL